MKTRIVLADDHAMVRSGLKAVIEQLNAEMEVVGEVSNGEELVNYVNKHGKDTDVYLVDISMPVLNGIEATGRILKLNPDAKVIILSMYDDRFSVEKALKAGALGYVVKVAAADEIVSAIKEAVNDRFYLCDRVSKYVVSEFLNKKCPSRGKQEKPLLTGREREVLQLIAEGRSSKQISAHLGLSLNTVHVHRNNIMRKLNIHKQAELVRFALKEGIAQL